MIVTVAVTLVACGSGGAAPLTSGSPPAAVAASPLPTPSPVQPIVIAGTNSKVTDPFEIPSGNYRVSWQATGRSNFIVHLQGQETTGLVNEILPNPDHGEVLFTSAGGRFILEVKASEATW